MMSDFELYYVTHNLKHYKSDYYYYYYYWYYYNKEVGFIQMLALQFSSDSCLWL